MPDILPVVDLFSGPGGLAEGFSAFGNSHSRPKFEIVLSVENEPMAYRTLLLRSFLRKFSTGFPPEYYKFLNGFYAVEPNWAELYPREWQAACNATCRLSLGTPEAKTFIYNRISEIRAVHGGNTLLLGGPPCQSYSVAGRARNANNTKYDPNNDPRQLLYREYADVLEELQPAVAVLENVKGLLSARLNGRSVFEDVLERLMNAGGTNRYRLVSLNAGEDLSWPSGLCPKDFLVRAEEHLVPQRRHRVFVVCVRSDIAKSLTFDELPLLARHNKSTSLNDVIGTMPLLRSRLSRNDSDTSWHQAVQKASARIHQNMPKLAEGFEAKFRSALNRTVDSTRDKTLPFRDARGSTDLPSTCPPALKQWIFDTNLTKLPNNETRGHIEEDIARYLFASTFGYALGKSPRAQDFPHALAAKHQSWSSGKFADRFRVQLHDYPSTTITSHIAKDGHYFIHPDPTQCRSLTVREAARLQTFPDNYFFHGGRTQQYVQVGNAVPPFLAWQIAKALWKFLSRRPHSTARAEVPHSRLNKLADRSTSPPPPQSLITEGLADES